MTDRPEPRPLSATDGPRLMTGNVLGMLSMMTWAAGFPAAEVLLDTWDPLAMVLGRFAMAMAVLLPLWFLVEGFRPARTAAWGRGLLIGGLGFGGAAWTFLIAQWYTDPVTVAIISASSPLVATVMAWLHNRIPLTRSFALGLAATLIGGIVATGGGVPGNLGLGALFALGSVALYSWASMMTVRQLPDLTALGRSTVTLSGGFLVIAVAFVVMSALGLSVLPSDLDEGKIWMLLAIYGIGGMALSQVLFIGAVERLGIAIASFHTNIAPFYVMLILLALGEGWSWPQAIGAAIVALGVILANR